MPAKSGSNAKDGAGKAPAKDAGKAGTAPVWRQPAYRSHIVTACSSRR